MTTDFSQILHAGRLNFCEYFDTHMSASDISFNTSKLRANLRELGSENVGPIVLIALIIISLVLFFFFFCSRRALM